MLLFRFIRLSSLVISPTYCKRVWPCATKENVKVYIILHGIFLKHDSNFSAAGLSQAAALGIAFTRHTGIKPAAYLEAL